MFFGMQVALIQVNLVINVELGQALGYIFLMPKTLHAEMPIAVLKVW